MAIVPKLIREIVPKLIREQCKRYALARMVETSFQKNSFYLHLDFLDGACEHDLNLLFNGQNCATTGWYDSRL